MQSPGEHALLHHPSNAEPVQPSLAHTLWGIDWRQHLPLSLTSEGICVEYSSFERASVFVARNYAEIFEQGPENSVFTGGKVSSAKARYYDRVGDFFEFTLAGCTIGLLVCTPVDWSTYYLRSGAVLREYQGRKLLQRFLPTLFDTLSVSGVERIEADTSPANLAMMHVLTRLRFNVTGTLLTERWGAHVHFTKFLDRDSEADFLQQFCAGIKYQARERELPGDAAPET
jgi:hypothetical protein